VSLASLREELEALSVRSDPDPSQIEARLRALMDQLAALPEDDARLAAEALTQARLALLLKQAGRLREAFGGALRAIELAERCGDLGAVFAARAAIGEVYYSVGQLDEALHWFQAAENVPGAVAEQVIKMRMNRASVLRAKGRLPEAAEQFDDLLREQDALEPDRRVALLINAASCYQQVERADDALGALDRAVAILPACTRDDLAPWGDAIRAWALARAGRPREAAAQALTVLVDEPASIDLRSSAVRALALGALLAEDRELLVAAVAQHGEALALARDVGAHQDAVLLHESAAKVHEGLDQLVEAVHHLREARTMEQRLRSDGATLRLEHEALRLELARLQLETEALRSARSERDAAERALFAAKDAHARTLTALSHDLRGPLTAIFAAAELLDARDPAVVERRRDQLQAAGLRMARLLDQATANTRVPAAPGVSARVLAQRSVDSFEALADRRDQRVLLEVSGAEASVREEAGRVIDNLLSNALKYGPPGGRVVVSVRVSTRDLTLEVLDQGPGFPDLTAADGLVYGRRLAARSSGGDSWGVGLHTVYALVVQLGGVLALGNRPEGGALVRVTLPVAPTP